MIRITAIQRARAWEAETPTQAAEDLRPLAVDGSFAASAGDQVVASEFHGTTALRLERVNGQPVGNARRL